MSRSRSRHRVPAVLAVVASLALAVMVGTLSAQPPAEPPAQRLVIGDVVAHAGAARWLVRTEAAERDGPRVLAFLPEQLSQQRLGLRLLQDLQTRYRTSVAVVGVARPGDADRLARLRAGGNGSAVAILLDQGDVLRSALARSSDRPQAVVLDAAGRLVAVEPLTSGLRHVIDDVVAGRLDLPRAASLAELLASAARGGRGHDQNDAAVRARQLIAAAPEQWQGWVIALQRVPPGDADTESLLRKAVAALAGRPEYLARVVAEALALEPSLAHEPWLDDAMRAACRAERTNPFVCRAAFELCAARGDDREATSWALACIETSKGLSPTLAQLAGDLDRPEFVGRFREARLLALDLALADRAGDAELLHRKLVLLVREYRDRDGAHQVGLLLVETMAGDVRSLNSFAWRLLTEDPYKGQLAPLALIAARAMTGIDGWSSYWRIDTLALAEFENGNVEDAVRLQQQAIDTCETSSRDRYQLRLDHYRSAPPK